MSRIFVRIPVFIPCVVCELFVMTKYCRGRKC